MREFLLLALLGLVALIFQSAAATALPAHFVPDLVLLVTIAAALSLPAGHGLILAAGIGYGADLLSGSLFGHHSLLRLLVFVATRIVGAQFHLKTSLALALFVFCVTAVDAAGSTALSWFFSGSLILDPQAWDELLIRCGVNALCAHLITGHLLQLGDWLNDAEDHRRDVRLETRRSSL